MGVLWEGVLWFSINKREDESVGNFGYCEVISGLYCGFVSSAIWGNHTPIAWDIGDSG